MTDQANIWPKHISVDKRIVTILSGSTYDNFPRALKEIIVNSYDADASEVKVEIDTNKEKITLEDNGMGMNETDFDFYLRIAGKSRTQREFTLSGRKRIGQFGVGFLSVFPFCRNYIIESKKRASNEILHATIPNFKYFKTEEGKGKLVDVDEIPIQGGKKVDNTQINKQFTKITLSGFSELTRAFFNKEYFVKGRRETILNYTPIKRLIWELSEDLPIDYEEDSKLNDILKYDRGLPFKVYVNSEDEPLARNVHATNILDTHKGDFEKIGKIKFKYFIASDFVPIKPVESRYLKIRNFNVGVGKRRTFGVGLEGKTYAFLSHLTGEIQILDGLNDLINVSRDDFYYSQDYENLQEFFRNKLRHWGNNLDKIRKAEKISEDIKDTRRIKSLETLSNKKISKNIDDLQKKGFEVKVSKANAAGSTFKIDKNRKQVIIEGDIENNFSKIIQVNDKSYNLKLDNWDIEETFPACKIKGGSIIINEDYPLFSNKRHLDIFVKMHAILALKYDDASISKSIYLSLIKEIETTFSDYIK
ncbi:MAG TPA: ATP-binding protein [Chitinophagaceae bacterium]|jgi:hypothetical protein|nr:ATP-binding protein [Chitinophagaceae bacterium]